MQLVRIQKVECLGRRCVALTLTNGQTVQRDLSALLVGPAFARIRADDELFAAVEVVSGGLGWPGGEDLCPDMILWGGLPGEGPVPLDLDARTLERNLAIEAVSRSSNPT
jgi:hypothetical protein